MIEKCYGKINLALDVFNIRDDGYHDIKSIMVPISFYDELEIIISNSSDYLCNKSYLKFNENNSIVKMIDEFKNYTGIDSKYYVYLNKHIPTQAGLAGGTSDAAATLRLLQKIHNITLEEDIIHKMCMNVGSDVLFNYYNRPAIVSGTGDKLEFIDIKSEYYLLLLKPKKGVSTKQAYELLDMNKCDHPDIDGLTKALKNDEDILPYMANSLEQPAFILNSDVYEIKEELRQKAGNSLMSGSGSTVFAISKDKELLRKLNREYMNSKYFVRLCKLIK